MPQIKLNVNPIDVFSLSSFGEDLPLVDSFNINATLEVFQDRLDTHIYSLDDVLLESSYNYGGNIKIKADAQTNADGTVYQVNFDPIENVTSLGYPDGDVKIVYNFLDDLYSVGLTRTEFFIEEISSNRTEIRLLTTILEDKEIIDFTSELKEKLQSKSYVEDFRINCNDNILLVGLNIETQPYRGYTSLVVKLYEPLPDNITKNSIVTVDRIIADSIAYEVIAEYTPDEITIPYLKGPNFDIEVNKEAGQPTQY